MAKRWWRTYAWWVMTAYVALVFGTLPFAREVLLALRATNLLSAAITTVYAVSVAGVVYHVVFDLRTSDWVAFGVVAALIGIIAALLLGLSIPEERVHFLQYALMALAARNAVAGASDEPSRARLGLWGGAVLAVVLGVADEGIQGLLPDRRFDWHDVGLNVGAVALALALDELLHDRLSLRGAPAPVSDEGDG